jgi:hypothetical protein
MQHMSVDTSQLSAVTRTLMELPGVFARARKSALASTAWMVMGELRNHIEYGGTGWAPLHPLTLRFRKFKAAPPSPLFWLGRFARYRIDDDAYQAGIGFGKSGKGKPGQIDDQWLADALARQEEGMDISVTHAMRKLWLTTKTKATRSGTVGRDWFSLRPSTTKIHIPARPIMAPVFKKVESKIVPHFQAQFHAALERYRTGAAKT